MTHRQKKIALVHDFLLAYGGAERVLQTLAEMYPEAPIYTLLSDPKVVERHFPGREILTSFLQGYPQWLRHHYRFLLPLFPVAVESLDLRDFDAVISSSGAWSKGIVTRLHTKHVAYLHSPMRFAWDAHITALSDQVSNRLNFLKRLLLSYCRLWDREAAERPDLLIANSHYTQARIAKYYRREATLIYPPALSLYEHQGESNLSNMGRKHFLVVARLSRSKKIDIVIEAFNKMELPLVVVGTGPEMSELKKMAGNSITFLGEVNDRDLAILYRSAHALIQPSEEDFGLVAVEALSFGTPVIAYEQGEAKEIILPGETGELFQAQTPEILADGVRRFIEHEQGYSGESMRSVAKRFSTDMFRQEIQRVVNQALTTSL